MENDGRVVAYSAIVGPFTTLRPTVNLTIPDLTSYHMTLASVTTNGVAVDAVGGVYTVFSNATVVATFAAESSYRLTGEATVSIVMDGDKTLTTTDMPTAEFISEASAPEVSQSATKVSARKTITLMATAAGATSYIWLKNGVQIEGGTSGTLTVNWRKPNGNPIDTYQAVAVYSINDLPVESERPLRTCRWVRYFWSWEGSLRHPLRNMTTAPTTSPSGCSHLERLAGNRLAT